MIRRLLAAPMLLAGGCADRAATYPSLAPRAMESRDFAEPAIAVAAAAPDPALDAELGTLATRLDAIAKAFAIAARAAERSATAARGRPAGSEPWLEAQTALAALDDWRAQVSALTVDVEQLAIARAATLAPPYSALIAIGDRADAETVRQAGTIARIQAMLAPA